MSFCLNIILPNCHFRLLRIAYSGQQGTHEEKKRFSRISRNPSCHPRHNFCLLLAQEWGIQRANRQEARKPQRGFTFHCAILISTTSDLQIEKKRAIYALPHIVFYPSARRRTDVFSTSCGEKKCFFSPTKNYLAVLDASTSLTKIKIQPKMQKKHIENKAKIVWKVFFTLISFSPKSVFIFLFVPESHIFVSFISNKVIGNSWKTSIQTKYRDCIF